MPRKEKLPADVLREDARILSQVVPAACPDYAARRDTILSGISERIAAACDEKDLVQIVHDFWPLCTPERDFGYMVAAKAYAAFDIASMKIEGHRWNTQVLIKPGDTFLDILVEHPSYAARVVCNLARIGFSVRIANISRERRYSAPDERWNGCFVLSGSAVPIISSYLILGAE